MNLYITGTPLGNLDDMSVRAVRTLKEVDAILCEDTRLTRKLTNHFEISTPLRSYHDYNKEQVEEDIIAEMKDGKTFALVSDAGMPVISDPGYELIRKMQEADLEYVVIPSASAFTLALVASGIPSFEFTFFGFLPKTGSKKNDKLKQIMFHPQTSVLYESPHKLKQTIKNMMEIDEEREVSISREITKKFEQHRRGTVREIYGMLDSGIPLKGEFVIVIRGYEEEDMVSDMPIKEHVNQFIEQGMKPTKAIKMVADMKGMKKQEVYNLYHDGGEG
ncbi:16S rRNA (cytidine(1402)-2'-O)-methyltransferase [Salinicoccus sp. Marseille-QA3877]